MSSLTYSKKRSGVRHRKAENRWTVVHENQDVCPHAGHDNASDAQRCWDAFVGSFSPVYEI